MGNYDIILISSRVDIYDIILPSSASCLSDELIDLFCLFMNYRMGPDEAGYG